MLQTVLELLHNNIRPTDGIFSLAHLRGESFPDIQAPQW